MMWTEWRWHGTRTDGSAFEMRGVALWEWKVTACLGPPVYGACRAEWVGADGMICLKDWGLAARAVTDGIRHTRCFPGVAGARHPSKMGNRRDGVHLRTAETLQ